MASAQEALKQSLAVMGIFVRDGCSAEEGKKELLAAAKAVKSARAITQQMHGLSQKSP